MKQHRNVPGARAVYSVDAPTLSALVEQLAVPSHHFVLLVAADTRAENGAALMVFAEALVSQGVSYACCWGPGCDRLEACFDEAALVVRGDEADGVIMTTAHADETLEEALWFALNAAWPTGEFEGSTTVVAAAVGSPRWGTEIRRYLDAGAPVRDEA